MGSGEGILSYVDLQQTDTKGQTLSNEKNKILRSPLFYVGDKYKLMAQLRILFPKNIDIYIEPFVGGGSSFLNTQAKQYLLNDKDSTLIALHKFLIQSNQDDILRMLLDSIDYYKLSCSFHNILPPTELRDKFKKTYFAKYNKKSYLQLRNDFNTNKSDLSRLYLLLIYGFNHMLRFNAKGDFNLPVGNVDFNKNVVNALESYFEFTKSKDITLFQSDYMDFLNGLEPELDQLKKSKIIFIYFDPPYLISASEYNKFWNEEREKELYSILNKLDSKGIQWGLSNLLCHKGKKNTLLGDFMQNYKTYEIKSNYISFNDNSIKKDSKEIYVSNIRD